MDDPYVTIEEAHAALDRLRSAQYLSVQRYRDVVYCLQFLMDNPGETNPDAPRRPVRKRASTSLGADIQAIVASSIKSALDARPECGECKQELPTKVTPKALSKAKQAIRKRSIKADVKAAKAAEKALSKAKRAKALSEAKQEAKAAKEKAKREKEAAKAQKAADKAQEKADAAAAAAQKKADAAEALATIAEAQKVTFAEECKPSLREDNVAALTALDTMAALGDPVSRAAAVVVEVKAEGVAEEVTAADLFEPECPPTPRLRAGSPLFGKRLADL